jgi:hypothetical protein
VHQVAKWHPDPKNPGARSRVGQLHLGVNFALGVELAEIIGDRFLVKWTGAIEDATRRDVDKRDVPARAQLADDSRRR